MKQQCYMQAAPRSILLTSGLLGEVDKWKKCRLEDDRIFLIMRIAVEKSDVDS